MVDFIFNFRRHYKFVTVSNFTYRTSAYLSLTGTHINKPSGWWDNCPVQGDITPVARGTIIPAC